LANFARVTILEASDRLGGKILTRKFDSAAAMYEAGVAEIYDYSMTGPDPLRRELIQHFGLQTYRWMPSRSCLMRIVERRAGHAAQIWSQDGGGDRSLPRALCRNGVAGRVL